MPILIGTVVLPEHWASALVNNDWTGLEGAEVDHVKAAIAKHAEDGWAVVSAHRGDHGELAEPWFTNDYHLFQPDQSLRSGSVMAYTVHKRT